MEINSLKNKLFDTVTNVVSDLLDLDDHSLFDENCLYVVCHKVGSSVRYDYCFDSLKSALDRARLLACNGDGLTPYFVVLIDCQTSYYMSFV